MRRYRRAACTEYAVPMNSDAFDPDGARTDRAEITPTKMFEVLADERRQYALRYLAQKPSAVPVGDVAEYVAVREGEPTRDRYERVLTGLYHVHLPLLTSAGLVSYDERRELVTLLVARGELDPYLRLLPTESGPE